MIALFFKAQLFYFFITFNFTKGLNREEIPSKRCLGSEDLCPSNPFPLVLGGSNQETRINCQASASDSFLLLGGATYSEDFVYRKYASHATPIALLLG